MTADRPRDAAPNQTEIWLACEMSEQGSLYNVYRAYRFPSKEQLPAVRDALRVLATRHRELSTAFAFEGDRLTQRDTGLAVPVIETPLRPDAMVEQLLELAEAPFALDRGPLARWHVLTEESSFVLLFAAHHIVCDGRSLELIFDELAALCRGEQLAAIEHGVAVADAVNAALKSHAAHRVLVADAAHAPAVRRARIPRPWLSWPQRALRDGAQHGAATHDDAGDVVARAVPIAVAELKEASARRRASIFSLLLAALYVALRAEGAPERLGIAVPYAGRRALHGDGCVGNFAESLNVVVATEPGATLRSCVAAARDAVLDAIERHEEDVAGDGGIANDGAVSSDGDGERVANVSLSLYESTGSARFGLAGAQEIDLPVRTAKYDLTVGAALRDDALTLLFSYRTALLSRAWIEDLANRTVTVLCAIPASPEENADTFVHGDRAAATASLLGTITDVWRDVLRLPHVGPDDDFIALGGYSLLAAQIVSRLSAVLERPVTLRDLFAAATPRALAQRIAVGGETPARERLGGEAHSAPITPQQSRIWYYSRSLPEEIHLTVSSAVLFEKGVNRAALAAAFDWVQRRHGALRTRFVEAPDGITQVVEASPAAEIEFRDEVADDAAATAVLEELRWTPFDLARVPLRASAIPLASGAACFVVSMHHTITDGWSMQIFFADLAAAYRAACAGEPMPAAGSPAQYLDYARARAGEERAVKTARLAYWRHALRGVKPPAIPADFSRESWSFSGATHRFTVPAAARTAAALAARTLGVSPAAFFIAAYANALFELSGSDDVLMMLIDANRSDPRYAGCFGFFTNIVPLRVRREAGAVELVRAVADEMVGAFAHADVPLGDVLDIARGTDDYRDYMRAGFDFYAGHRESPGFGTPSSAFPVPHEVAKYDFNVGVVYGQDGPVDVLVHYRTDLFRAASVQAFGDRYAAALVRLGAAIGTQA
ncbi:MAG: non-ribosomal peptide synthetase [Candidatus Eremiobacteraeota bacterium]|nr:non-ribosomal peptide synthetase [Candidatus Eremiobacteraeota bacterium]